MHQPLKHTFPPVTLIYVEDSYNNSLNNEIRSNFTEITQLLQTNYIRFIYLPFLQDDANFKEKLHYNRPYLNASLTLNELSEVYAGLKKQLQEPLEGEALVSIIESFDAVPHITAYPLAKEKPIITQLQETITIIRKNHPEFILQHKLKASYDKGVIYDKKKSDGGVLFKFFGSQSDDQTTADDEFDEEAYQLAYQIKEKIKQLQETGAIKLLSGILEEVLVTEKKLSTIFITHEYQIYLKDYEMKEVVMAPLPKAIFLLFLQHPEGIYFKNLSDYHDELLSIYKNLTIHEDIHRSMQSIKALTDPLDNSINEKCSRIRAAFLEVITDELAKHYYITGNKGEAKKIMLDRSLVVYQ